MVFYDKAQKGTLPKNEGTVVHWLSLADLSANSTALSESFDPTAYALSSGDMTAQLEQFGDYVSMSDLFMDTAINGTMKEILERMGRHAAKKLDIVVRDRVLSASTVVKYGGTAVARNSIAAAAYFDFGVAQVRKAKNFFSKANAMPMKGQEYVAVAEPDVIYDLEGDSNWLNAHIYTEKGINAVYDGEVGKLYGTRFVENTNALILTASGSASTNVYQTYMFGEGGFGVSEFYSPKVIVRQTAPESALEMYGTVGWKASFATRELLASAMLRYETGASLGR